MIISCAIHAEVGLTTTTTASATAVAAAPTVTAHEPVSIVHSGKVIVRQIDAPIHPILVYHKFHIDNRQNSVHSLLSIANWINATRTIPPNNTIRDNGMAHTKPVPMWQFVKWFYYMQWQNKFRDLQPYHFIAGAFFVDVVVAVCKTNVFILNFIIIPLCCAYVRAVGRVRSVSATSSFWNSNRAK